MRRVRQLLPAAVVAGILAAASVLMATTGPAEASGSRAGRLLAPLAVCPGSNRTGTPIATQLAQMRCLITYARDQAGLPELRETRTLDRAASLKVAAVIRCGAFTHKPCRRPFESVFAAAGYPLGRHYVIGENLAYGRDALGSPYKIMLAWLNSPKHRANLLSRGWRVFGVDVRVDTTFLGLHGVAIWANEFAGR